MSALAAPGSWRDPARHWISVVTEPYYRVLVDVQDCLHHATNDFFREAGLGELDLPCTTGSISSPMGLGSDSLPVEIELLGARTYLADSMQFMLELGCRLHHRGVYYKAVSFRGEASDATHLNQFHHVECEIPGGLDHVMRLGSALVHRLTVALLEERADAVHRLAGTTKHLERLVALDGRFPALTMKEAVEVLRGCGDGLVRRHPAGFDVVTREGEGVLVDRFGGGLAVWLQEFEALSVPFYQAKSAADPARALNADLVIGRCEALGCGQRHLTRAEVQQALDEQQLDPEPYAWYLEMRELRPLQTAGFGLGLERYLMWALCQSDIRNCTLIPRARGDRGIP
jgi:asparaginyl-tRNA synthetase